MNLKKELKRKYEALMEGQKKRAAQVHGCESTYFTAIVNGQRDIKDESKIEQMIQSIKQASKDILNDAQSSYDEINEIKVNQPEKV